MARRAAVVRNPPPRDRDVQSFAVPTAECQLSFELPAPLELLVPGLQLVPKLGGPERKRMSYTHESARSNPSSSHRRRLTESTRPSWTSISPSGIAKRAYGLPRDVRPRPERRRADAP